MYTRTRYMDRGLFGMINAHISASVLMLQSDNIDVQIGRILSICGHKTGKKT